MKDLKDKMPKILSVIQTRQDRSGRNHYPGLIFRLSIGKDSDSIFYSYRNMREQYPSLLLTFIEENMKLEMKKKPIYQQHQKEVEGKHETHKKNIKKVESNDNKKLEKSEYSDKTGQLGTVKVEELQENQNTKILRSNSSKFVKKQSIREILEQSEEDEKSDDSKQQEQNNFKTPERRRSSVATKSQVKEIKRQSFHQLRSEKSRTKSQDESSRLHRKPKAGVVKQDEEESEEENNIIVNARVKSDNRAPKNKSASRQKTILDYDYFVEEQGCFTLISPAVIPMTRPKLTQDRSLYDIPRANLKEIDREQYSNETFKSEESEFNMGSRRKRHIERKREPIKEKPISKRHERRDRLRKRY